ncbi:MAG: Hint domain-containing protein [Pseudomonadota bacterium]
MPFLYIYSPDDFVGGLPDEQGASAAGTGPFTLTLKPGAKPTLIEVADNEAIFDEVDGTQSLDGAATIDGTTYAAGTTINTAYDLINTADGHKVTSFHFGGDGYQQGAVDGLVSTQPLLEGQSYTFDTERTSHQQNNLYDDYFACFADGTLIDTPDGPRPVEALRPGHLVETRDGGALPVRKVLSRKVSVEALARSPALRPVIIAKGALGPGVPHRDLHVSPQHRMLVRSPIAKRMFGTAEALVAAKRLLPLPGVSAPAARAPVTYFHLVMDGHQIVWAEGAETESFYPGPMGLAALSPAARAEMEALFPGLSRGAVPAARPIPQGARQRRLIARHLKNGHRLQSATAIA